jgi:hypothetical protein
VSFPGVATFPTRYKKGRPYCGRLLREKTKQPFNVCALNPQKER